MLTRDNTVLIIIDVQGNLARVMDNKDFVYENVGKIIKGVQVLEIPIILMEQANLGQTIPKIKDLIPSVKAITKETFSCCGNREFMETLTALQQKQILICGIETHVCIYQTAIELIALGYDVHVVADAVASRTAMNRELGLQKMLSCGVSWTTVEMTLYELLGTAADSNLRDIVKIVK